MRVIFWSSHKNKKSIFRKKRVLEASSGKKKKSQLKILRAKPQRGTTPRTFGISIWASKGKILAGLVIGNCLSETPPKKTLLPGLAKLDSTRTYNNDRIS